MANYYAIAEAGEGGSWWISFPGRDGIVSAADDARLIVSQARDALGIGRECMVDGCRSRSKKAPLHQATYPISGFRPSFS